MSRENVNIKIRKEHNRNILDKLLYDTIRLLRNLVQCFCMLF